MPSREDLDAIDCIVMDDLGRVQAIAEAAAEYQSVYLSDAEVDQVVAFLNALTDKSTIDLRNDVPPSVPSGETIVE